jgi:hypothetical protein
VTHPAEASRQDHTIAFSPPVVTIHRTLVTPERMVALAKAVGHLSFGGKAQRDYAIQQKTRLPNGLSTTIDGPYCERTNETRI